MAEQHWNGSRFDAGVRQVLLDVCHPLSLSALARSIWSEVRRAATLQKYRSCASTVPTRHVPAGFSKKLQTGTPPKAHQTRQHCSAPRCTYVEHVASEPRPVEHRRNPSIDKLEKECRVFGRQRPPPST